jgi:hypothetical protein
MSLLLGAQWPFIRTSTPSFRINRSNAPGGTGMTQFGRALAEFNVEIICANSSQAKGRVERVNRTLKDRLVKELRLANISYMDAGNAFLPSFFLAHNERFAATPVRSEDMPDPSQSRQIGACFATLRPRQYAALKTKFPRKEA